MPQHTPTPILRALSASAFAMLLLAGCATVSPASAGDPFPGPPSASLDELLGVDRGADGKLFDDPAHVAELLDLDAIHEAADAELAKSIAEAPDAGGPKALGASASHTISAAASVTSGRPAAPGTPGTPGIDQSVTTSTTNTTSGSREGRPYTSTTNDTNTIRDQREVSVREVTTVSGDPAAGDGATETLKVTQEKEPCAAEGEPAGTWKVERTQTFVRPGGIEIRVSIVTSGAVVRGGDGTVSLRGVSTVMTGGGSKADGTTTSSGFTVNAEIGSWDTRGDITDARGTWTVADRTDFSEADAIALAGADLDAFHGVPADVADRGEELRDSQGVCVRIVVDTHGVTTLGDGEKADFDVRVIDPKTGEEIDDAPITADTYSGSVSPTSATGHGSFAFTASGDPVYRVNVSTKTSRGGHSRQIQYGAEGWKFDGLSYSYTIPTASGEQIPATITWSGEVCGDVGGEWKLSWRIDSIVVQSASGTMQAVEVGQAPGGERVALLYQRVDDPADGEPPFTLWIDDVNSATIPDHQRVEVHPEPMTTTCVEG